MGYVVLLGTSAWQYGLCKLVSTRAYHQKVELPVLDPPAAELVQLVLASLPRENAETDPRPEHSLQTYITT